MVVDDLLVEVKTEHRDTVGHGMDYLNQVVVTKGGQTIYDSEMQLWRNGRPNMQDHPELHIVKVGIKIESGSVLLAVATGKGMIEIDKIENGKRHYVQRFNKAEADRAEESKKFNDLTDLPQLRGHFRKNKNQVYPYSPWTVGNSDFECELGRGFLAYHNGHPSDTVWDYGVAVVVHGDTVYVSDLFGIGLEHHGKFTTSTVLERKIEGNKFEMIFSSGYHRNPDNYPKKVSFELNML